MPNIQKIAPWAALAASLGLPIGYAAYQAGKRSTTPPPPPSGLSALKEYVQPESLAGAGIGTAIGAMLAQHMRQPPAGYGRHVPVSRRPEELVPGAATGGTIGFILANMLRDARLQKAKENENAGLFLDQVT